MKDKKVKLQISTVSIFLLMIFFLVACNETESPESIPVTVTRSVVETVPTETAPECTLLSDGITLEISPLSQQSVTLIMTGLQPGEQIQISFDREGIATDAVSDLVIEQGPITVDDNGRIETKQGGLEAREDGLNRWEVKVTHSQGIACMTVDL